jgi:hypothetical protein
MESNHRTYTFALRLEGREAFALQRLGQVYGITRGEFMRNLLHQVAQQIGLLTPADVADLERQPQYPGAV